VDPEVFACAVSPYDEPVWLCHLTQLSLLCGARGTADAGLALGLRGAVAGGVGQCRLSRIPLQVRLAHPQSHGDPRWCLLPHALCLAARRAHPAHSPGVIGVVSPSDATAAGTQILLYAAISAVRVGAYRIRSAKVHTGVTEVMAGFAPIGLRTNGRRCSDPCTIFFFLELIWYIIYSNINNRNI